MIRKSYDPEETLDADSTQKIPVSSVRFKTTAHLHDQSGVRYSWASEDIIVTGSLSGHHVRAYELIDAIQEDELWVEIPLQEALVHIALSRLFVKDARHPVVRSYVQVWEITQEHVDMIQSEAG